MGVLSFVRKEVRNREIAFSSIVVEGQDPRPIAKLRQLLLNARHAMGRAPDGLDPRREDARELLSDLASRLARLAPLDVRWQLPLGYRATARRP